jgi:hypothetical protein
MAESGAPVLEMSQAEYARHRGVSRQAIGKLIGKKITLLPNGKIDVVAADRALGETRERVTVRDDEPDGDAASAPEVEAPRAAAPTGGLTKAKTVTEVYRARLAQLEYEEKTGKLIPAAAAAKEWARTLSKLIAETETFLHATLARDTAERFGLDWKAVSVTFREAYRKHRAAAAEDAHAELARFAEVEPIEPQLAAE